LRLKTAPIMRSLPREVITAVDRAVEVNDGVLEPAYIHSPAKKYKTSLQAVVRNVERYNKVMVGCDDRKKGAGLWPWIKAKQRIIYQT